jgi:hypothetical protein
MPQDCPALAAAARLIAATGCVQLLIAVGRFCPAFGETAAELGVAPAVVLLDDSDAQGAVLSYEFIHALFRELVRNRGADPAAKVARQTAAGFASKGKSTHFVRISAALRAVACPEPIFAPQGTCRVQDPLGVAALRLRQSPRVFRNLSFDGRSELMYANRASAFRAASKRAPRTGAPRAGLVAEKRGRTASGAGNRFEILGSLERSNTHNVLVLYGESGAGRSELAAQLMLWYLDRARLSSALWGNCDRQADISHRVTGVASFLSVAGAMLQLGALSSRFLTGPPTLRSCAVRERAMLRRAGVAARKPQMSEDILLRALKATDPRCPSGCRPARARTLSATSN